MICNDAVCTDIDNSTDEYVVIFGTRVIHNELPFLADQSYY